MSAKFIAIQRYDSGIDAVTQNSIANLESFETVVLWRSIAPILSAPNGSIVAGDRPPGHLAPAIAQCKKE
ncbi:hypothetical protein [Baaleninema sp.]|uniref:hypothetical protein n=1 Tax=Baaleninema sp. TaxID=3101197 RepID=UPI003CFFEC06